MHISKSLAPPTKLTHQLRNTFLILFTHEQITVASNVPIFGLWEPRYHKKKVPITFSPGRKAGSATATTAASPHTQKSSTSEDMCACRRGPAEAAFAANRLLAA